MLKMFDVRTKVDETKLIKNALANKDVDLEEVFEVIDASNNENYKSWFKGFAAGTSSLAGGLALGVVVGKLIIRWSKS